MRRGSPPHCSGDSDVTWSRSAGLLAWPHGWQRPARTEEWAYEQYASSLERPLFAQLVCYPWATLIDLLGRGHTAPAESYLDALAKAPPPTTLVRATVCQHIHAERILPWLKTLGITDLFWTHSRVDAPAIDGIRVHPFPLYPVRCHDRPRRLDASEVAASTNSDASSLRKYLYSFIGAYCPDGYLTQVRQWIFDLPSRPDALVLRRSEWHYESVVYEQQIGGRQLDPADCARHKQMAEDFDAVDARFDLLTLPLRLRPEQHPPVGVDRLRLDPGAAGRHASAFRAVSRNGTRPSSASPRPAKRWPLCPAGSQSSRAIELASSGCSRQGGACGSVTASLGR